MYGHLPERNAQLIASIGARSCAAVQSKTDSWVEQRLTRWHLNRGRYNVRFDPVLRRNSDIARCLRWAQKDMPRGTAAIRISMGNAPARR